jgi:hypothetical protein
MEDRGPLCMSCADLAHLVFLPRGDAALTRRARKHSRLSAVVVRFSRARRRYERQGVFVQEAAIDGAEAECLADADARAGRGNRERERRVAAVRHGDTERTRNERPHCCRAGLRALAARVRNSAALFDAVVESAGLDVATGGRVPRNPAPRA